MKKGITKQYISSVCTDGTMSKYSPMQDSPGDAPKLCGLGFRGRLRK